MSITRKTKQVIFASSSNRSEQQFEVTRFDNAESENREPPAFSSSGAGDLLSNNGAASYLGIAGHTLTQWRCNRRVLIPFVKIGRKLMYRKSALDAYIAANTHFGMEASRA